MFVKFLYSQISKKDIKHDTGSTYMYQHNQYNSFLTLFLMIYEISLNVKDLV